MSQTNKVSNVSSRAVEDFREKRETFDESVKRLLGVFNMLKGVSDTLGPGHPLRGERPPGQHEKKDIERR